MLHLDCPWAQFDRWFKEAVAAKVAAEPNQMALATADAAGAPSVRMVLLKGYDARGFVFYTNYDSRKAAELANGRAALSMYWEPLQRSVRAHGQPKHWFGFRVCFILMFIAQGGRAGQRARRAQHVLGAAAGLGAQHGSRTVGSDCGFRT